MEARFGYIISEIEKYSPGIHELKEGVNEHIVQLFENQYKITIPLIYKQWLQIHNGGEFFALPVGIGFAGILGTAKREKGVFYLEDNFDANKRVGIPNNLLVIGELCDGEIIGFDLQRTTKEDGCIVQFDPEFARVVDLWDGFEEWLKYIFEDGSEIFDYEGNDK